MKQKAGCSFFAAIIVVVMIGLAAWLLAPFRINLLILGIDRSPEGTDMGRSDTIILATAAPFQGKVGMLSIPRDLWIAIPGVGENRINAVHFFAEINEPGSGPRAAADVVEQYFKVKVPYTLRFRFDGFTEIIDAMGGITVELKEPTAGLEAGSHTLNGEQALAFVRDRKGSDDFNRMTHGQMLLKATMVRLMAPETWLRLPDILGAILRNVDTTLPPWEWPRLAVAFLRSGMDGIDMVVIKRDMVTPFTTSGGAMVLQPNWDVILPVVQKMFGE